MTDIATNLTEVRSRITEAATDAGRDPSEVTLVAVSKVHPATAIREAYAAGQRHFGENYAQELRDKAAELSDLPDIRWHFIGHLQRNKAKYVAPSATLIETVDSERLVEELQRQAERAETQFGCLVQVNVGGEEQKSGCEPEQAAEILEAVEAAPQLALAGLMTIPPWDLEADETRVWFEALRELRNELGGAKRLPHLSMGMSHDFEEAIEEGATIVRVGTAIFGARRR
ncbi:MAG: YggS family pyridoxal phosphate-dependent enzyme [Deltaproteobacteria bacterium]|nr:YggS family pyridoxal phosphate-dependent enzyme [Deltaproteobacteria bacterium]